MLVQSSYRTVKLFSGLMRNKISHFGIIIQEGFQFLPSKSNVNWHQFCKIHWDPNINC